MQVITEPGADEALHSQWEGKLVYADGVESIAEAIRHYTSNEPARLARQKISWGYARDAYALPLYLKDIM